MAADLVNYQWELGGVVFGVDSPVQHEADATPGTYSWRTQDQQTPGRDANSFGRDLIEPGTWAFKLFVDGKDEANALEILEDLGDIWRGDDVRSRVGAVKELRYRLGGRTRVCYGRPRRFDYTLNNAFMSGYIPVTADFKMASELYFDDFENYIDVGFLQPTTGGFEAPFITPLTTENIGGPNVPYTFAVGGRKPTPMMIDFKGPLTNNPSLQIDGRFVAQLQRDVPDGVTVTVDARPWVSAVYREDDAGVAGILSPRSRMPDMKLSVGTHVATLGGSSPTGTGKCRIRWRPAYPTV